MPEMIKMASMMAGLMKNDTYPSLSVSKKYRMSTSTPDVRNSSVLSCSSTVIARERSDRGNLNDDLRPVDAIA